MNVGVFTVAFRQLQLLLQLLGVVETRFNIKNDIAIQQWGQCYSGYIVIGGTGLDMAAIGVLNAGY